jgi:penicillinase repressor
MRKAASRAIPPPLELLCLNALWSRGEGSVKEVRELVAPSRALAYTTVMTVLERLARRGIVTRRKAGRAFVYAPRSRATPCGDRPCRNSWIRILKAPRGSYRSSCRTSHVRRWRDRQVTAWIRRCYK